MTQPGHTGENTNSTGNSLSLPGMKKTHRPYYHTKQHTQLPKKLQTNSLKVKGKDHSFWCGGVGGWGLGREREMSSLYAELDQITRTLMLFVGFILNLQFGPTLLLGSHAILNASASNAHLSSSSPPGIWTLSKSRSEPCCESSRTGVTH